MARRLLLLLALVIGLATVVAAAATLEVNGGTIQVFTFEVDLPGPEPQPSPPPGSSGTGIEAEKTASAFLTDGMGNGPGVEGEICVTNTGDRETEDLQIIDTVQYKTSGGGSFQDGPSALVDTGDKPQLGPGDSYCYAYVVDFDPPANATAYRNIAHVTITNHSGHLGEAFGPSPKADFSAPQP